MTTLFFTYSKNSKPRFSLQPAMLSLLLFFAAAFSNCNPTKNTEKNSITPYNKDDFKSLLWEMTGNGLRKPSYLFGTIHLIPEKQFFLSDLVKLKLTESKRLCLEIDLDDPSTVSASLKGVMRKGIILKDLLNADDYAFIVKKLDSRGIPISMVKTLKPLLVSTLLLEKTAEEKMLNY